MGRNVGGNVGENVGERVGGNVGVTVGGNVGARVGIRVGTQVGARVGARVGEAVGVLLAITWLHRSRSINHTIFTITRNGTRQKEYDNLSHTIKKIRGRTFISKVFAFVSKE